MNPEKIKYQHLVTSTDPWVHQPVVSGLNKHVHEVVSTINNQYDGHLHEASNGLGIPFEAIEETLTYYGVHYLCIIKDRYRLRIRNQVMMKLPMDEIDVWLRTTLEDGISPISRLHGNNLDLAKLERHVEEMPKRSKRQKNRTV